jgi:hypothetical protein
MSRFLPVRIDGRSDAQILLDLVKDAGPDTLFPYEEIEEALGAGITEPVTRARIYRAAGRASMLLESERSRTLRVLPGQGFRVARAEEHVQIARQRRRYATRHMTRAEHTVEHTCLEELDEAMRRLTIATATILGVQRGFLEAHEKRLNRHDALINSLFERIEKLEKN